MVNFKLCPESKEKVTSIPWGTAGCTPTGK